VKPLLLKNESAHHFDKNRQLHCFSTKWQCNAQCVESSKFEVCWQTRKIQINHNL